MGSPLGPTLDALAATIAKRRDAGEASYTFRLLTAKSDVPLKKVVEEAGEVALAGKDVDAGVEGALDHLRYEAADLFYHMLVVLERYGIGLDDLAAELNTRMTDAERPEGARVIEPDHVRRA